MLTNSSLRTGRHRILSRLVGVLLLLGCWTQTTYGEEPYLEFIRGLRDRGYYDTALEYLTEVDNSPNVPPEVREVLPYERALTLLEGASKLTSSKARREQLDAAQAAFEQFVQSAPRHPLAGRANTEQARILMEKAKVDIWDADDPANESNRSTFQESARKLIQQARGLFEQALAQHESAFQKFPLVIPEEEKVRRRERDAAEQQYLRAKLDLAETVYYEAQTFDRGSEQRKQVLEKAIEGFKAIHEEHRSQIAGLIARLYEGKCFEEMDMIREALGIYNELLGNPGTSEGMKVLQSRALRFRLICLNHPSRHDYKLVIEEAQNWRQEAGPMARTDIGMGILYEMCRAEEALGQDRTAPENQQSNYLNQALLNARQIARYPGELKGPALAMVRRLSAMLNRSEQDPDTFSAAYGLGEQYKNQVANLLADYQKASEAGDRQEAGDIHDNLLTTASEMTRMFDLALKLVEPGTDVSEIANARLQLAYSYYVRELYYEAAVAAEFAVMRFPARFDDKARQAAFLRLASFESAFLRADPDDREFEKEQTVAVARELIDRWPDSDYATDARNAIAKIYWNSGDKAQAAEWWAQTPPTAADYAKSQVQAGQAYWTAYGDQMALDEGTREPVETLNAWKAAAETHLQTGIDKWQAQVPEDAATPDGLVLGKLTLAQIRNLNGVYQKTGDTLGAIELLTEEPHSVLKAVDVPPGENRPTDPSNVKSAKIAGFAYQQLLRAYIGVRNLEAASDARAKLEQVAGGDDSASLTQIYVDFGKELQQEMDALRASGNLQQLNDVRAGFEDFLNSVYERESGQTYNSLLWIAETFTSLGEGSTDDPARSEEFFSKAAAMYNEMISRAQNDETFLDDPKKLPLIRLQLAICLRRQGNYGDAEQAMLKAVSENPGSAAFQFEAARLYQDWAKSSSANADKFNTAISGSEADKLWGWKVLGRRLQASVGGPNSDAKLETMYRDALYNLFECYLLNSRQQASAETRDAELDKARLGLETFIRITAKLPPEDYDRFNTVYQEVRSEMDLPSATLASIAGTESAAGESTSGGNGRSATRTADTTTAAPADGGPRSNVAMVVVLVLVGLAAVVGLYFLAVGQDKRRHRSAVSRAGSKRK